MQRINASSSAPYDLASAFVSRLAKVTLPNVFNPYFDHCPYHDRYDAVAIRRSNLELVLAAALNKPNVSLWLAQDLGRKGGRRTGLALTDELHLDAMKAHWKIDGIARATSGNPLPEATAGFIWRALESRNESVFLWNVFPLQPHPPREPLRNRGHTRQEADQVSWTLKWILENIKPKETVAIGRVAYQRLADRGIECRYVRHPSRGGGQHFLQQINGNRTSDGSVFL